MGYGNEKNYTLYVELYKLRKINPNRHLADVVSKYADPLGIVEGCSAVSSRCNHTFLELMVWRLCRQRNDASQATCQITRTWRPTSRGVNLLQRPAMPFSSILETVFSSRIRHSTFCGRKTPLHRESLGRDNLLSGRNLVSPFVLRLMSVVGWDFFHYRFSKKRSFSKVNNQAIGSERKCTEHTPLPFKCTPTFASSYPPARLPLPILPNNFYTVKILDRTIT